METLHGSLTQFAQARLRDRTALVYVGTDGQFRLERAEQAPLGLGDREHEARTAVHMLARSQQQE